MKKLQVGQQYLGKNGVIVEIRNMETVQWEIVYIIVRDKKYVNLERKNKLDWREKKMLKNEECKGFFMNISDLEDCIERKRLIEI